MIHKFFILLHLFEASILYIWSLLLTAPQHINALPSVSGDTVIEGTPYISLDIWEELFSKPNISLPLRQKVICPTSDKNDWYFTVDNPYATSGNHTFNFIYPIRRGSEHIYVPLYTFRQFLKKELSFSLFIDSIGILKLSNSKTANILNISTLQKNNGTIVDIFLSDYKPFQKLWVPPYLIIKITHGILNTNIPAKILLDGVIQAVTSIQEDKNAQINLYIPGPVDTIETSFSSTDSKLSIVARAALPQAGMAIKQEPKVTKKKTIIIDPGHGGRDPGAISNGIMEKTITLKVAKKLKSSLQKAGYNVLLTRTTDTFVPLQDRPKFAAQAGGDLFISLHCNAIDGSATKLEQIQGYVAYILRAGKSEEDITLARRENKAIILSNQKKKKAEISPVEWILLEHELNLYSHQSEKLAENIVNSFKSCKIIKHRTGAHQAGFFVLVGTFMPAVLFEMGFITNQKDRSYMVTNKGQKDISSRLFNAIQSFFQQQK